MGERRGIVAWRKLKIRVGFMKTNEITYDLVE